MLCNKVLFSKRQISQHIGITTREKQIFYCYVIQISPSPITEERTYIVANVNTYLKDRFLHGVSIKDFFIHFKSYASSKRCLYVQQWWSGHQESGTDVDFFLGHKLLTHLWVDTIGELQPNPILCWNKQVQLHVLCRVQDGFCTTQSKGIYITRNPCCMIRHINGTTQIKPLAQIQAVRFNRGLLGKGVRISSTCWRLICSQAWSIYWPTHLLPSVTPLPNLLHQVPSDGMNSQSESGWKTGFRLQWPLHILARTVVQGTDTSPKSFFRVVAIGRRAQHMKQVKGGA